jgi:bla regulator protein BlaR1
MCAVTRTRAQPQLLHADGPLPSFEVVSIKPFRPKPMPTPPPGEQIIHQQVMKFAPGQPGAQRSDRVHMILPVQMLIANAYNLPFGFGGRVSGGPEWVHSTQYVVDAKIEDAAFAAMQKLAPSQQHQQVELMGQALLADRFHLEVHFEKRMAEAYALDAAKSGPKLTPAKEGETTVLSDLNNTLTAKAASIVDLIHSPFLSSREIVDRTGLTGRYDFTLTYSERMPEEGAADAPPSLAQALQQQLGLKLEPAKTEVEYIVIDHIDPPAEN